MMVRVGRYGNFLNSQARKLERHRKSDSDFTTNIFLAGNGTERSWLCGHKQVDQGSVETLILSGLPCISVIAKRNNFMAKSLKLPDSCPAVLEAVVNE